MITGSGFVASRLPHNLGSGQREQGQPPSWGSVGRACGIAKETISKIFYQVYRSLGSDIAQPDTKSAGYDVRCLLKLSAWRSDYPNTAQLLTGRIAA